MFLNSLNLLLDSSLSSDRNICLSGESIIFTSYFLNSDSKFLDAFIVNNWKIIEKKILNMLFLFLHSTSEYRQLLIIVVFSLPCHKDPLWHYHRCWMIPLKKYGEYGIPLSYIQLIFTWFFNSFCIYYLLLIHCIHSDLQLLIEKYSITEYCYVSWIKRAFFEISSPLLLLFQLFWYILDIENLEYLLWNIDSSISDIFLVGILFEYREIINSSIPMYLA